MAERIFSGDNSRKLWDEINGVPPGSLSGGDALYALGCACQKLEDRVVALEQPPPAAAPADRDAGAAGEGMPDVEILIVQLAGCATAAQGHTANPAVKSDYGWSPAYQDVLDLRQRYDAAVSRAENAIACAAERQAELGMVAIALGLTEPLVTVAYVLEAVARLTREAEGHAALVAQVRQMRERSTRYLRASDAHELLVMDLENITSRVDAALASSRPEATERPIVAASPEGEKCVVCLGCLHRTPCDPTEAAPPTCALGHELEHVQPGFPRVAGSAWGWHRVGHPTCVDRAKAEREGGEDE